MLARIFVIFFFLIMILSFSYPTENYVDFTFLSLFSYSLCVFSLSLTSSVPIFILSSFLFFLLSSSPSYFSLFLSSPFSFFLLLSSPFYFSFLLFSLSLSPFFFSIPLSSILIWPLQYYWNASSPSKPIGTNGIQAPLESYYRSNRNVLLHRHQYSPGRYMFILISPMVIS